MERQKDRGRILKSLKSVQVGSLLSKLNAFRIFGLQKGLYEFACDPRGTQNE